MASITLTEEQLDELVTQTSTRVVEQQKAQESAKAVAMTSFNFLRDTLNFHKAQLAITPDDMQLSILISLIKQQLILYNRMSGVVTDDELAELLQ